MQTDRSLLTGSEREVTDRNNANVLMSLWQCTLSTVYQRRITGFKRTVHDTMNTRLGWSRVMMRRDDSSAKQMPAMFALLSTANWLQCQSTLVPLLLLNHGVSASNCICHLTTQVDHHRDFGDILATKLRRGGDKVEIALTQAQMAFALLI